MARYIDYNKVMSKLKYITRTYISSPQLKDRLIRCVKDVPAADVQEVRHGKWKECFEDWRHQIQGNKCSACGFEIYGDISNFNYCPNCGAKMDEDGD